MDIRSGAGQTWGKFANNIHTLNIAQDLVGYKAGDDIKFTATIPQNGFPHKNRCLVMIDSFSFLLNKPTALAPASTVNTYTTHYESIMSERSLAVSLDGLGVMNSYDTLNRQNDIVGVVDLYINKAQGARQKASVSARYKGGDIFSRGVLAQSPFGKSLGIRILDPVTLKPLTHTSSSDYPQANGGGRKTSISLVLKILFLDEEDMKSV